jgi:hypothetical protein
MLVSICLYSMIRRINGPMQQRERIEGLACHLRSPLEHTLRHGLGSRLHSQGTGAIPRGASTHTVGNDTEGYLQRRPPMGRKLPHQMTILIDLPHQAQASAS